MPDFSMEDMVMDMASQILPPMLASLVLLLPLSLVSMEDTLEPDDMLQTLEELFMLPSVKLKLMPDFSMEDMAMDMASQILPPMLASLDLLLPLSLGSMEDMLGLADMLPTLLVLFMLLDVDFIKMKLYI